jgi:aryl-alcohol dehydrogenase-like predicted oxidoreductase
MIPGKATPEGTAAYAKQRTAAHAGHWRESLGLTLSSLGMGTYLGNADPVTDGKYEAAALKAFESGINVVDTAINYRYQRSERSIGVALRKAVEKGFVSRDQVLLCTKGGYVSGELQPPSPQWFADTYVKPGLVTPEEIAAGCHCMAPKYLRHEVEQSRKNLGVETIDVYYVHNPETQVGEVGDEEYYKRLTAAFRELEAIAAEGKIQWYGTATWNAYRVPRGDESFVSLEKTLACAEAAGGAKHRCRVVQLPYNLGMTEAQTGLSQELKGQPATAIDVARAFGLALFTSVPLLQTRLLGHPAFRGLKDKFPGVKTDAQRCLQFVRSTPGVAAPLCGMKDVEHVAENAKLAGIPPLPAADFEALFESAGG